MNFDIKNFARQEKNERIRITILDTGYDEKLLSPEHWQKKRLKINNERYRWRDFWELEPKSTPVDEDGHGTSMLSLFMKICPSADVFVARVARFRDDLADHPARTRQNIVKAGTPTLLQIGIGESFPSMLR